MAYTYFHVWLVHARKGQSCREFFKLSGGHDLSFARLPVGVGAFVESVESVTEDAGEVHRECKTLEEVVKGQGSLQVNRVEVTLKVIFVARNGENVARSI